ncbi:MULTISPECIES: hypothetical protein [unclassified Streptomyces]|uniref:hypothetical protein n=1 Tax=unclassified Streptomyces TaxID=2593676 RepID=UPI0036FA38C0
MAALAIVAGIVLMSAFGWREYCVDPDWGMTSCAQGADNEVFLNETGSLLIASGFIAVLAVFVWAFRRRR